MEEKIINLLREFAVQIGTTVDKLLAVMSQQAVLSTYSYFIGYSTILIAFVVWLVACYKGKKLGKIYEVSYESREIRDGRSVWVDKLRPATMLEAMFGEDNHRRPQPMGLVITWVISFMWWGIGLIVFLSTVGTVITRLRNPQYWAITKLMGIVF